MRLTVIIMRMIRNIHSYNLDRSFLLGGERNRNIEFRFRLRHCQYRNSDRKKTENL